MPGIGFDDYATDNLWQLIDEQRAATSGVPTDTTLVVERFRDELGDWRVILHSPYGLRVHGPLALAVGERLYERYGIDEKPTASDDGIIVRLPDTDDTAPGADIFVFEPDEIEPLVTAEVGGSALFASRFRECAARALLLPRRHPGKRSPLWHQRQRAAQLLDVARRYSDFPIVLEAVRECLQDVYDVPTLTELMGRIAQRRVRLLEVETPTPSPFAASLLFGYVGAFMYEGDSPLAERRAAALALDPTLLAELLGRVELRELLDADVVANTAAQLQHLTDGTVRPRRRRRRRPAAPARAADRAGDRRSARPPTDVGGWLEGLLTAKRVVTVSYRRADLVGGRRGHRPAARRCRRRGPRRGADGLLWSRWWIHSANCWPATPVPAARSPPAPRRRGSGSDCGWPPTCSAGWPPTASWCAASSPTCPPIPATNGVTPRCCGSCGAARWRHCARRSSR